MDKGEKWAHIIFWGIGALIGMALGFEVGGLGGAIFLAVVGGWIGDMVMEPFFEAIPFIGGSFVVIAIISVFLWLVGSLWGVGN